MTGGTLSKVRITSWLWLWFLTMIKSFTNKKPATLDLTTWDLGISCFKAPKLITLSISSVSGRYPAGCANKRYLRQLINGRGEVTFRVIFKSSGAKCPHSQPVFLERIILMSNRNQISVGFWGFSHLPCIFDN